MYFFRVVLKRCIQIKIIFPAKSLQDCIGKAGLIRTGLPARNRDCTFIDTQRRIRYHKFLRKFHLISKSKTFRARSKRIIKWKTSRLYLFYTDPTIRTGKTLAEIHRLFADYIYDQQSFCQMQHIFHRICQPLLNPRFNYKPIHNDLNIMLDILVQCDLLWQFIQISIYTDTHITTLLRSVQ